MNKSIKPLLILALAVGALSAAPANALVVTFGGAKAYQDNVDVAGTNLIAAGLTSSVGGYIDAATNTVTGTNVFLETFDALATGYNDVGAKTRPTAVDANFGEIQWGGPNGGFNSLDPNSTANGGDLTITNGTGQGMGIRKGTTSYAAAPGSACAVAPCDATYYAYGPGQGGSLPSSVKVNYANLLHYYGAGSMVDYLGVYYGSVDTYNEIRFFDANGNLIHGSGALSDGILSGTEVLNAMSGSSGNQSSANSNVYVNLSFGANDHFSSFAFYTTGVAFEIDNVVTHISQVPEPASLALVALGLLGLAGLRRRA